MTLDVADALRALPTCAVCGVPRVDVECFLCRARLAEQRLAAIGAFDGSADDWMARVALLRAEALDTKDRLIPLGFEGAPSKQPVCYTARAQVVFKPWLRTVDPACAVWSTLIDFLAGNRSQLVDATPLPLSLFSPQSWTSPEMMATVAGRFAGDTAMVAQDIRLTVAFDAPVLSPIAQEAYAAQGRPMPDKFRAILWGTHPEIEPAPLPETPWTPGAWGAARNG